MVLTLQPTISRANDYTEAVNFVQHDSMFGSPRFSVQVLHCGFKFDALIAIYLDQCLTVTLPCPEIPTRGI